jgi:hypothetical protein
MSKQETLMDAESGMSVAELNLGKVLALLQRVLPRLDEPDRAAEVQTALEKAGAFLETAREAHAQSTGQPVVNLVHGAVSAETVAAIAAAISTVLASPYRLLNVQKVPVPTVPINTWAVEGRTQIFMSHKVR